MLTVKEALPDHHVWGRFWICSLLISHHEEGTACGNNQGEEGDADTDLLGETTNVASAEDVGLEGI